MTFLMTRKFILIYLLTFFWHITASGEAVYVMDKFRVGMYEKENLNSKITKILKTGDELEIIEEKELMSLVKDSSQTKGWIDNNYLMRTKPAALILKDLLEKELKKPVLLKEAPGKRNGQLKNTQPQTIAGEPRLKDLTKKNTQLKTKLAQVLPKLKKCESHASILEKKNDQLKNELVLACPPNDSSSATTVSLEAFQEVKKKLEDAEKIIEIKKTALDTSSGHSPSIIPMMKNYWLWSLAIALILVGSGMLLGAYFLDCVNRRRHGGFRI